VYITVDDSIHLKSERSFIYFQFAALNEQISGEKTMIATNRVFEGRRKGESIESEYRGQSLCT